MIRHRPINPIPRIIAFHPRYDTPARMLVAGLLMPRRRGTQLKAVSLLDNPHHPHRPYQKVASGQLSIVTVILTQKSCAPFHSLSMSRGGSILFSPKRIKDLVVPNRFVCSAVHMVDSSDEGFPTQHLLDHYVDLSEGKVGLIIPGYVYHMKSGKATRKQTGMATDAHAEAWKDTISKIHSNGSKIVFQVCHGGINSDPSVIKGIPSGPSAVRPGTREMTIADIEEVIDEFRKAAKRLRKVGADGIMLHAAHGYLISEFLSPILNRRTDKYGGSPENRARILHEIVDEVCKETTPEFILSMKINGSDCSDGGCVPEYIGKVVASLPKVDLTEISCSCGDWRTGIRVVHRANEPLSDVELKYPFSEGYNMEYAKIIKAAAPQAEISTVGGFRSFDVMESAVASGVTDFVSIGRPFIREPFLVRDFLEGKSSYSTCASCGQCMVSPPVKCNHKKNSKK